MLEREGRDAAAGKETGFIEAEAAAAAAGVASLAPRHLFRGLNKKRVFREIITPWAAVMFPRSLDFTLNTLMR